VGEAISGGEGLAAVIRANQSTFVGDVAGFGLMGAATGEHGITGMLLDHTAAKEWDHVAVGEDAPYWQKGLAATYNRGMAAVQMGAEGVAWEILGGTLKAVGVIAQHQRAKIAGLRASMVDGTDRTAADFLAMARASVITDPSKRSFYPYQYGG
jgi:hypothetical protein